MQNPRLAHRYAKSLFDLAVEKNLLELVLSDVKYIDTVLLAHRDLSLMLSSPIIRGDKKIAVIDAIFKTRFQEMTLVFVHLLVKKGREYFLAEVTQAFLEIYNTKHNIQNVIVTTAVPMTEAINAVVMSRLNGMLPGVNLAVDARVDSNIIGGFVIETGNTLLDESVRKKLSNLATQVMDYTYVSRL
jgi:F-type H+-transporting ATPase subunit delta